MVYTFQSRSRQFSQIHTVNAYFGNLKVKENIIYPVLFEIYSLACVKLKGH